MWSYGRFLYCSPHCWAPGNNIWRKTDVNKSRTSSCSSLSSSSSPSLIRGSSKRRTRSSCSWASSPPTATSWAAGSGGLAPGEMAQVQNFGYFTQKENIWKPPRIPGHFLMTFPGNWEKHLGTFSHRWALAWGSHQALDCLVSSTRIWEKGKRVNIDISNIVILLRWH